MTVKTITAEQIGKLKEAYVSNKAGLKDVEETIEEYGITDDGLTDVAESFEQGYNNALEYVFNILGIDLKMTTEKLKKEDEYSFECNMSEEYKTYDNHDEWGCAYVWLGDIGVEYNFCFDGGESCCAIYKMELNNETDYDTFIHYDIDFSNPNWEEELENAMCKAMIELHNM